MKSAQISIQTLKAVSLCSSKEETRYYIKGVFLEISKRATIYVATDGHKMLAVNEELPDSEPDNTLIGKFIIPIASCSPFKADKRDTGMMVLSEDQGRMLRFNYANQSHGFEPIDGTYPDWRRVLPSQYPDEGNGMEGVTFDTSYLDMFAKASKLLGLSKPKWFPNGGAPCWVSLGDEKALGVIMPMRSGLDAMSRPSWVDAREEAPGETMAVAAE